VADVVGIVPQSFLEAGHAAPPMNLRIACDARAHHEARIVSRMFFSELASELWTLRSRTDETHLAAQHIPELKQFVQAESAQHRSNSSAPRVAWNRPNRAEVPFGLTTDDFGGLGGKWEDWGNTAATAVDVRDSTEPLSI